MEGLYDTHYRGLSNDAAHPSATALNRHVEADAQGVPVGLRWGPNAPDVTETLWLACTVGVYLVNWVREKVGDETLTEEFGTTWDLFKRQHKEFEAQTAAQAAAATDGT